MVRVYNKPSRQVILHKHIFFTVIALTVSILSSFQCLYAQTPSDDHGDTFCTATMVELNRSIPGRLETCKDWDYFRFDINSTGTITAFTTGDTDTTGILSPDFVTFKFPISNNDGGSGKNFLITRKLYPGTYYIGVSGSNNRYPKETGSYSFRVNFRERK